MTDLKITTVNQFDQEGIFPLRTIRVRDKTIPTPAAANIASKLQERESVHPDSRGVSELYRSIGGDDLDEAMRHSDGGSINSDLKKQFERAPKDDLKVTFTKYTESSTLPPAHASYLVELHSAYSDIITVPMMPKLIGNIEDGLSDPNYRSFKKSVVAFLNQVEDRYPEKPVMGLIPRLGWKYIDDLMSIYEAHDVLAYAFDFERCKVTTGTQLGMLGPLMQSIANRGIEENVLFYAINPHPGLKDDSLGARPASDITSLGLGFDIVGGRHVSPNMPQSAFEKMEADNAENDVPEFRLFDREDWLYRDVPVSELPEAFPEKSAFNGDRVAAHVKRNSTAKYRLQQLVNSEQQALAARSLRELLEGGNAYSNLTKKLGVTGETQSAFKQIREEFDDSRFQSGIGDFAD